MPDIEMLKEKIDNSGISIVALAAKCGVSRETFYNRMSGKGEFKASEINALTVALHLSRDERDIIFFGD